MLLLLLRTAVVRRSHGLGALLVVADGDGVAPWGQQGVGIVLQAARSFVEGDVAADDDAPAVQEDFVALGAGRVADEASRLAGGGQLVAQLLGDER